MPCEERPKDIEAFLDSLIGECTPIFSEEDAAQILRKAEIHHRLVEEEKREIK